MIIVFNILQANVQWFPDIGAAFSLLLEADVLPMADRKYMFSWISKCVDDKI